MQHIQLFLTRPQRYRDKIRHWFPGIFLVLEEIKKEINNVDTIKLVSKYRRPLWDERGLARLGGKDAKDEGQPAEVGEFHGRESTNDQCQILRG